MASLQAVPGLQTLQRTNRLISKEDILEKQDTAREKEIDQARNRRFGLNLGDRKKSVSKSIQRHSSMNSLVDYTLKFLNDDMAINLTKLRVQDPLIEKSVEDEQENQSQINKMIF